MQTAEAYLHIVRDRGRRRLPLADVYPHLYNPELYLLAYAKIAKNAGALTPGTTPETADGMSLKRIQAIIEALRHERYRWTPVRRIYIEKPNSTKKRPLGLPTWSDKLLQEVLRLILEAYYEPQFSHRSHGFRPGRGCHTALVEIHQWWKGTTWFIEGDISACFDSLDHEILLNILRENIHDNRLLRLIGELLKAGYLEDWKYHATYSGTPQGGIISPILSNIYLDRLDTFVTDTLIGQYTRGERRRTNTAYNRIAAAIWDARQSGNVEAVRTLAQARRALPSQDPNDPDYRRLRYIRYADDWLLGFTGPRAEAEDIKASIGRFLADELHLELSDAKTLITHGRTEQARFLGYNLTIMHDNHRLTAGKRAINGGVTLLVPPEKVKAIARRYTRKGKPIHRSDRRQDDTYSIMKEYDDEYRGIVQYYRLAQNLCDLMRVKRVMEVSLSKTLANKYRISVTKVYRKFRPRWHAPEGPTPTLQVSVEREGRQPLIASWSLTTLRRDMTATIRDEAVKTVWNTGRSELLQRLLAETCELCGSRGHVEVHHIRGLRDLKRPGRKDVPTWVQTMASRRRKTLVVCEPCHQSITHGRYDGPRLGTAGEPDAVKVARPVRREAVGKVPA